MKKAIKKTLKRSQKGRKKGLSRPKAKRSLLGMARDTIIDVLCILGILGSMLLMSFILMMLVVAIFGN